MPTRTQPRGPADPDRRDRIVRAVLDIIEERGLIGVTHRTVAKRAGVPLGSTTYYFDSLDDLLAAALDRVNHDYETYLRDTIDQLAGATGVRLARALTDLVLASLEDRDRTRAEYALWLAAMDRPRLRPLAVHYTEMSIEALSTITPRPTAVALTAALDGMFIRGLVAPQPLDRTEVEAALTAILRPAAITAKR